MAERKAPVADYAPLNNHVNAMLTDLYQISMTYAYWSVDRQNDPSVFDLFFRKNPFKGEFTVFAGLDDCLRYINTFNFTVQNIADLKSRKPDWNPAFWDYLGGLDTSEVKVFAIPEGTVVFPREPLIRIEGPLAICQLLETTLLNAVNFPSLVATCAARIRLAAGPNKNLLEFGLRRAQGPDGAMSASKYAYMGGFDGTSNVSAAVTFGMAMKGTHAHSFVVSFSSLSDLKERTIKAADGKTAQFVDLVMDYKTQLDGDTTNIGELASFVAYAQAYPTGFLALVDTYDTLESGVVNFLAVALALVKCGYKPVGIRLDSGDLAYLSKQARQKFKETSQKFDVMFDDLNIVASNDINEDVLWALNEQKHEIDTFGIGTHLVTCYKQPALGCVYKLVSVNDKPRIKISQEIAKVTIPGRKEVYRMYNKSGEPILDLLTEVGQQPPIPHRRVLCRHPFAASKRVYVTPSKVEALHELVWDGQLTKAMPSLQEIRERVRTQLETVRTDHLRRMNPTPYKLSVTSDLYSFMHDLWLAETPVREIH